MKNDNQLRVIIDLLGTLANQVCEAQLIIDEFIKQTSKDTYDTIHAEVVKKMIARDSAVITKMKNILVGLNPNKTDAEVQELLRQLSADRN